jgi:NitT/TauT family transport system substrate-binding protein
MACVKAYYELDPALKPDQASMKKRLQQDLEALEDMQKHLYHASGDKLRYGEFDIDTWKNYVTILQQGGVIGKSVVPVDHLFTNEFVGAFNDFDAAKVRAQAESLK